jgi:X-X-X-Leu-X-X-Gly heptad repeat protein
MSETTNGTSMTSGRQAWLWASVVISVIVLILAVAGLFGTWIGRSAAINVNNRLMDGIIRLTSAGEEAADRVGTRITELNTRIAEVESAVDQVAQNVSDRGLVLTLLPPEKEQNLVNTAGQIRETANTITTSIRAAVDLYNSVNAIPFVNLPGPDEEKIQNLGSGVQEIQDGVDQLAADIQDFRESASAEVIRVSTAVGTVKDRVQETDDNLATLESDFSTMQTNAQEFKSRFSTRVTVLAVVITLFLLWVIYGMVIIIRDSWLELQA